METPLTPMAAVGAALPGGAGLGALAWPAAWLLPLLLSLRVGTVLLLTPLLQVVPVPGLVKAALLIALSVALALGIGAPPVLRPLALGDLLAAAVNELLLGAVLALGVALAFAAFTVAGQLLDVQLGLGIAQVLDPASHRPVPLLATLFNLLGVLVFFLVDGHHQLLRGLAASVGHFPVGADWSLAAGLGAVLTQAGAQLALGFALAAPVVLAMLLLELALGVVARSLPQVNMLTLGIPLKIVVGLAVLALWCGFMLAGMQRIYQSVYTLWGAVFATAPAGG